MISPDFEGTEKNLKSFHCQALLQQIQLVALKTEVSFFALKVQWST